MTVVEEKSPPSTFIFSVTEYMDDHGRRIVHRNVVSGTPPATPPFHEFVAVSHMIVELPVPGGKPKAMQHQFNFPVLKATDIASAFALFDENQRAFGALEIENIKRQLADAARRAAPGLVPVTDPGMASAILDASGNPVRKR